MNLPRLVLAFLFVVVFTSQATFTVDVIRELAGDYPATPVYLSDARPIIYQIDRGYGDLLHPGDRLLTVDGRSLAGKEDLAQTIRAKKPGDTLRLTVDRQGQRIDSTNVLRAFHDPPVFDIVWNLFMPWFSIALGFWVVAVRPRDLRAWSVLAILLGLGQVFRPPELGPLGWPSVAGVVSVFYSKLAQRAWPAGMLLLGIDFPRRWRFDERVPWVKWLLVAMLAVFAVWDGALVAACAVNYANANWIPAEPPEWLDLTLMATCIGGFFFALGTKRHDPKAPLAPDEQRRVKLLQWGCQIAFTPFSVVFFYALIFQHRLPEHTPVVVVALAAMVLLPVTLAYVILVERALDVRVVVRQGLQYALARGGIRVIQLLLGVLVVYLSVQLLESKHVSPILRVIVFGAGILLVVRMRELGDILRRWLDRRFFREAYDAERILGDLSEQVRAILDTHQLLDTVTRKIAESLHVGKIAVFLPDGGCFRPALATGYPAPLDLSFPNEAPIVARLRKMSGPLVPVAGENEALTALDTNLLLPLSSKNGLLGFISLGAKRSEEPYSSSDARLLSMVTAQTGLALENSRLSEAIAHEVSQREMLNREIEIAREVQQRLFPQNLPKVASLDYAGHCRPALGVGGDYYDFLSLPGGQLGLAIADISGKGIPAALLMASLQASVRGQSQGPGDVSGLLTNVNSLVYEASPASRYATFFYARFDPRTRRLTWSNGGHNPPILLRGDEVIRLETGGSVVGLFPSCKYEQDAIALETGDLLILYTDGMSEAENPAEEEWGEDALIATARACDTLPPSEMIPRIMEAADAFANGAPQHDDMTLVIARVTA